MVITTGVLGRNRHPSSEGLSWNLRELAQAPEGVPDIEKEQAVRAHGAVLGQHEHVLGELVLLTVPGTE